MKVLVVTRQLFNFPVTVHSVHKMPVFSEESEREYWIKDTVDSEKRRMASQLPEFETATFSGEEKSVYGI